MSAPIKYARWMSANQHRDKKGFVYRYHSRSDAHSIALCTYIMEDLLDRCPVLTEQAEKGLIAYGINLNHIWPATGKSKTFDLAVGCPDASSKGMLQSIPRVDRMSDVLIACEAKSVMTEHGKSQPRVYDELSSSHEIVHQGRPDAIAAGIAVVNIAARFASPLRQTQGSPLLFSTHNQPHVTARMINHLRGLPVRERVGEVGFDAYCTFVVECDNQGLCGLWSTPPAPQPGERDYYETFIDRIVRFYTERFSVLS